MVNGKWWRERGGGNVKHEDMKHEEGLSCFMSSCFTARLLGLDRADTLPSVTRAGLGKISWRYPLIVMLVAFVGARVFYFTWCGLRFDASPLDFYYQFVDPALLRTRLWESVTHLHSQPPGF